MKPNICSQPNSDLHLPQQTLQPALSTSTKTKLTISKADNLHSPPVQCLTEPELNTQGEAKLINRIARVLSVQIGSRVTVGPLGPGVVRYLGPHAEGPGDWVGVALDKPVGQHDGEMGGKRYFLAQPGHGTLVKAHNVAPYDESAAGTSFSFCKFVERAIAKHQACKAENTAGQPPSDAVEDQFEELLDPIDDQAESTGSVRWDQLKLSQLPWQFGVSLCNLGRFLHAISPDRTARIPIGKRYLEVKCGDLYVWALEVPAPPKGRPGGAQHSLAAGLACLGLVAVKYVPEAFLIHNQHPHVRDRMQPSLLKFSMVAQACPEARIFLRRCDLPNGLCISTTEQWMNHLGLQVLFSLNGMRYTTPAGAPISTLALRQVNLFKQWSEFLRWLGAYPDEIKILDLSGNFIDFDQMSLLRTYLAKKPGLESLIFDDNCLSSEIGLNAARELLDPRLEPIKGSARVWDLSHSKLSSVPVTGRPEAYLITNARFSHNMIVDLSPFKTGKLRDVTILNLSFNRIQKIDDLTYLSFLVSLILTGNKIASLPLRITKWEFLRSLNVSHNVLTSVAEVTGLRALTHLDISHNRLTALPRSLPGTLKSLELTGNELRPPFDALHAMKSNEEALQFLKDLREKPGKEWRQLKVVTAGPAGVGKTHLTRRLQGLQYSNNQSTDGLEVNILKKVKLSSSREIDICIYDLGGQEVFYPTHQFFLSGKTMYLIVFDARNPDLSNIEYWIRTLKTKNYQGIQAILVGTHIDQVSKKTLPVIREGLRGRFSKMLYPMEFHTAFVDCTGRYFGPGIDELKSLLLQLAEKSHIFQQDTFELISTRAKDYNFVEADQFKALFAKHVENQTSICCMQVFLHEAGAITYFHQPELRNIVVINPQWLADLMACLVSFKVKWANGRVTLNDLRIVWKKYPPQYLPTFVTLLEKFEILYKFQEGVWAIPCMLPETKPPFVEEAAKDFDLKAENPVGCYKRFRTFTFDFVPRGFFPQMFVRLLHLEHCAYIAGWFNGLILADTAQDTIHYQRIFIEMHNAVELHVTALVPNAQHYDLFSHVMGAITGLFTSHFHLYVSRITAEAACTHCLATAHETSEPEFGMIPVSMLEFAFVNGLTMIACPKNMVTTVALADVAPDVCLAKLPLCSDDDIQISKNEIGRGASGIIYKGNYNGHEVAIKALNPDAENFHDWHHEVLMLSRFDHPNIVKLHGIMLNPLRMVMDLCNLGDLYSLFNEKNYDLSWKTKTSLLLDIARGVRELHNAKPPIIHRDLRSPNIFITEVVDPTKPKSPDGREETTLQAKVGDLGLSRQAATELSEILATWRWVAPEAFRGQNYDQASDVYSFAILCWTMAHPKSWPYDDAPDEFKKSRVMTLTKSSIESNPDVLTKYRADPITYKLSEEEDGVWRVTETQLNEMSVQRAIQSQGLRPQFANPECPVWLREMTEKCWDGRPQARPTFNAIVDELERRVEEEPGVGAGNEERKDGRKKVELTREEVEEFLDRAKAKAWAELSGAATAADPSQRPSITQEDLLAYLSTALQTRPK